MNNDIKYFSTGEFAKLCKVHKKTLFYYDEIDLFKPEKITSNGYRYYSINQLEVFNIIYILKDLGVSLKEIKNLMDKRNPKDIEDLFIEKSKEIEREINKLKIKQQIISNKIKIINEAENITDEIIIENQSEEFLLLSSPLDKTKLPYDLDAYTEHLDFCYSNDLYIGYPIGSMKSKNDIKDLNFNWYSYFYTKVNKDDTNKSIVIKPKGKYLVGYMRGYYDSTQPIYKKLLDYIKLNNLTTGEYFYEDVLLDEVTTINMNDYVLKISIQIK